MSVRIPMLRHFGVLLTLCLFVCVYQGLKVREESELVEPTPRHRLWGESSKGGTHPAKCIEVRVLCLL